MSSINELLSIIPVDQIATRLGVDEPTAQAGIVAALPSLLAGMDANAQDPAGAAALADALRKKDTSLATGGVDVAAVDVADGEKIVHNVFGDNTDQVVATLGAAPGAQDSGLMKKLLPMLAPIVMAWVAKKFLGGDGASKETASGSRDAGGLGDLLGGLLGGGKSTGGGLGDILGGALGTSGGSAGAGSGLGGGLGDLLGGLLGGGKRR